MNHDAELQVKCCATLAIPDAIYTILSPTPLIAQLDILDIQQHQLLTPQAAAHQERE
jgi:hypothetical protein